MARRASDVGAIYVQALESKDVSRSHHAQPRPTGDPSDVRQLVAVSWISGNRYDPKPLDSGVVAGRGNIRRRLGLGSRGPHGPMDTSVWEGCRKHVNSQAESRGQECRQEQGAKVMGGYRVIVIGSGFGGRVHVSVIREHPDFEIAALLGATAHHTARAMAKKLEVPYIPAGEWNADRDRADVLVVATPPYQHADLVLKAFRSGMHVLVEKPLAASSVEAAKLVLAEAAGASMAWVHFEFRMLPARRQLQKLVAAGGSMGRPLSFYWIVGGSGYHAYSGRPTGWLTERSLGGGYLGALGSHLLDYLIWLFGDVASVQALEVTDVAERTNGLNRAEDGFTMTLEFLSGVTGVLHYRSASRKGLGSVLEVTGTDGGYRLVNDERLYVFDDQGIVEAVSDGATETLSPYQCTQMVYDAMARELAGGERTLPTLQDGLAVQTVMDAVHQAHRTGMRVRIA